MKIRENDSSPHPAEKVNLWNERPEVVKQMTAMLEEIVRRGRSTPGPVRSNEGVVDIWAGAKTVVKVP